MTEIWLWVTDVGAGTRSGTGVLNGGGDLGLSAAVGDHRGLPLHER